MAGAVAGNSPNRFASLDAIRGGAAIIVMAMHSRMLTGYDFFPQGYLLVDLFFLMSGFVIGHAYDKRLQNGGYVGTFMLRRYARLVPMWTIGLALGSLWMLYGALRGGNILLWATGIIWQLAFLPLFWKTLNASLNYLFPANTPGWSLFFELLANLFYGLFARLLHRIGLIIVVAVAWLALAWIAIRYPTLDHGGEWSAAIVGLARVGFGFFLGLLLYKLPRPDRGARATMTFLVTLGLVVAFCHVRLPAWHGIEDLAVVTLILPLLLWSALAIDLRRPAWAEALGMISYPLYTIHLPIMMLVRTLRGYLTHWSKAPLPVAHDLVLLAGIVGVAWLLGRFVDPRAQRWAAELIHQRPVRVPA